MSASVSEHIEVVNRHRDLKIDRLRWAAFGRKALAAIRLAEGATPAAQESATIAFVGDRTIRRLNREFRGKDIVTDVLSFPRVQEDFELTAETPNLGDVIISIPQATRQAAENGAALDGEIEQLILHGLLHLCGYDHERDAGEMNRLELRLRRRLGIE